jgi:hypothetical protein
VKFKIAVMDLKNEGVGPEAASLLTGVVSNKLASFGIFTVISREDIKNLLKHEQDQILLGCDDEKCLLKLGDVLGAENLVAGSVGMVGQTYVVNLQLLEVSKARVAKRVNRQFEGSREKLLDEMATAAAQVVEDILKAEAGSVLFTTSEEGADIAVDGRTVGTSPLASVSIPAGPHDVRVSKQGFVDWARTLQIRPREAQVVEVTQIPSAKFIEAYEDKASSMRRWAWIAAAAFVAFEATAAGLRTYTWQVYDPIEERYISKQYDADHPTQLEYYNAYKDEMQRAEVMDYTALAFSITGALVGAVSLVLFLEGDDPGRYQRYHGFKSSGSESPAQGGGPAATLGIGSLGLRWEF